MPRRSAASGDAPPARITAIRREDGPTRTRCPYPPGMARVPPAGRTARPWSPAPSPRRQSNPTAALESHRGRGREGGNGEGRPLFTRPSTTRSSAGGPRTPTRRWASPVSGRPLFTRPRAALAQIRRMRHAALAPHGAGRTPPRPPARHPVPVCPPFYAQPPPSPPPGGRRPVHGRGARRGLPDAAADPAGGGGPRRRHRRLLAVPRRARVPLEPLQARPPPGHAACVRRYIRRHVRRRVGTYVGTWVRT